jgi:PelA/Pel-15E family pectate lyase
MRELAAVFCGVALFSASAWALDQDLVNAANEGMAKAVTYLTEEVAYGGGYLGSYLEDLSDQWGEGHATRTQNWIQPPGNPSVGFAFLRAWEATGDQFYLDAAKQVADSLVYGQLQCGGWDYIVDHAPEGATRWFYRHNEASDDDSLKSGRNTATFDDNVTQHATRLLMAVDQALEEKDEAVHDAALYALDFILQAQHDTGGWPQRFPPSGRGYGDFFTFNDNSIRDCCDVMMIAYRTYGDERYDQAVRNCGDFIIAAQLPEPQAVWGQQYDYDLKPAWARRFEPPGPCGGESNGVLSLLIQIALFTGDENYLEPIPRALDWYNRSQLPNGRWARFYELKTNRPLYLTSDNRTTYWLTYDDSDLPDHYSFNQSSYPTRADQAYSEIKQKGIEQYLEEREPALMTAQEKTQRAEAMEADVRKVLEAQDGRGRWVRDGKIWMQDFERNIQALATYLRLVNDR